MLYFSSPFMDNAYFLDTTLLYETEEKKKPKWPIFAGIFVLFLIVPILIFSLQKINFEEIFTDSREKVDAVIPKENSPKSNLPKPTTLPTITVSPSKKEIKKGDLKINVQNGGGVAGAASRGVSFLKNLEYNVVSSGNADNFNYKGLTIQIKESKKEYLETLEKDLKTNYFNISSSAADLEENSSVDALIIIGR